MSDKKQTKQKNFGKNSQKKTKNNASMTKKSDKKSFAKKNKVENKDANVAQKTQSAGKIDEKQALLYKKIGYTFKNRDLLTRALTHPSKSKENYQRLEFLGDSVLNFLVAEFLFKNSNGAEGDLTVLRAHFISEEHLSKCFDELEIEPYVIAGKSLHAVTRAIKGDIMESIIAAIYLDSNMNEARKFVIQMLHIESFESVTQDNYKTILQELVQANFKCSMKYQTLQTEDGFESKFYMDDDVIATGYGSNKIHAEQNCAMVAINKLFKDETDEK